MWRHLQWKSFQFASASIEKWVKVQLSWIDCDQFHEIPTRFRRSLPEFPAKYPTFTQYLQLNLHQLHHRFNHNRHDTDFLCGLSNSIDFPFSPSRCQRILWQSIESTISGEKICDRGHASQTPLTQQMYYWCMVKGGISLNNAGFWRFAHRISMMNFDLGFGWERLTGLQYTVRKQKENSRMVWNWRNQVMC
jgi:hypothetical protein